MNFDLRQCLAREMFRLYGADKKDSKSVSFRGNIVAAPDLPPQTE
jgi:hypothetical protein